MAVPNLDGCLVLHSSADAFDSYRITTRLYPLLSSHCVTLVLALHCGPCLALTIRHVLTVDMYQLTVTTMTLY